MIQILKLPLHTIYQYARGRLFSPGTPASSTTKSGRHDIAEILLKVALNTIKSKSKNHLFYTFVGRKSTGCRMMLELTKIVNIMVSFMAYQRVCNKSYTKGATCGTGTAYPSEAHEFTPGFNRVRVAQYLVSVHRCLSFCSCSCVVCPLMSGFWIPLWYLRFTTFEYLFGILDLRLLNTSLVS